MEPIISVSLIGILLFILGALALWQLIQTIKRVQGRINQRAGRGAELEAVRLLKKEGFKILDHQPRLQSVLMVNGERAQFDITPDLLVSKDGVRYIVEVKRYRDHTTIANADIRRQILEYLYATGIPCLLVRMPEGDIDLIELEA